MVCWILFESSGEGPWLKMRKAGKGYTLEHSLTDLVLENHYQLYSFDWFMLENLNETNIYQHVSAYISIIYHMYIYINISVPAKHGDFLTYVRLLLAICILQHKMAIFANAFALLYDRSERASCTWWGLSTLSSCFMYTRKPPGGAPPSYKWVIIPLTIDISPINHIVIGLICTNLANELGHHRKPPVRWKQCWWHVTVRARTTISDDTLQPSHGNLA